MSLHSMCYCWIEEAIPGAGCALVAFAATWGGQHFIAGMILVAGQLGGGPSDEHQ